MSVIEKSAVDLKKLLEQGELSSVQLVSACLDQIAEHDTKIHAFLKVNSNEALQHAEAIDARRQQGKPLGLLAGIPVAVKDLVCTKGYATTCGSRMLENFIPPYDATVIRRLKEADAIIIGKTNMDEFAMGSSNENSAFGPTRNPWNTAAIPGGSSGGSAACVAASMSPLSIGSDTGGSIRQPAALTGVTGMKPTYGRVSRYGLIAFASSLDQIGPMARSTADVALMLQVLAGHDAHDSTSANVPVPDYLANLERPLKGLRIGWVREHYGEGLDAEVEKSARESIEVYKSLGATIEEVSLSHSKYGVATYYIIAPSEASSNLARYDGVHYGYRTNEKEMLKRLADEARGHDPATIDNALVRMYRQSRAEGFGPEVKRRIMLGTYALSAGYYEAYYLKALKVRRLIREDYDRALEKVDLILGPTTPTAAFPIGECAEDPLSMYLADIYTVTTNLAGLPGISIPCGLTSAGMPIGLHLQAGPFEEEKLLRAAQMFQSATEWHKARPESL